ncbi:hypothetical protein ACFX13_029796 [Malus domestica]
MASAHESSPPISSPVLPNVSNFLTIKLDHTNYPLWQAQMLPLLRSRNLVPFVDGTSVCPPAFLKDTTGNTTTEPNLAYEAWIQQDAMVMSWLNNSVHPTVLATLIGKTSSYSIWTSLRDIYDSQSTGRLLQLRSELMNTHRGDTSIADFLDRVNGIADTLSLSGSPISDEDLVAIVLNNVGPAYESTVASAQARDEAISYAALEALLLSAERRQKGHSILPSDAVPTILAAQRGGRSGGGFRGRGSSYRGGRGSSSGGYNFHTGHYPKPGGPRFAHPSGPPHRSNNDGVLGTAPSNGGSGGNVFYSSG